jgi:hypothetical protein
VPIAKSICSGNVNESEVYIFFGEMTESDSATINSGEHGGEDNGGWVDTLKPP